MQRAGWELLLFARTSVVLTAERWGAEGRVRRSTIAALLLCTLRLHLNTRLLGHFTAPHTVHVLHMVVHVRGSNETCRSVREYQLDYAPSFPARSLRMFGFFLNGFQVL